MTAPSLETIEARILPEISDEERIEDRQYRYEHANGRLFLIRYFGDTGAYFMSELIPNGRLYYPPTDDQPERFHEDSRIDLAKDSPNDLNARIRDLGLSPDNLIRVGGGLGVAARFFNSLRECAQEIQKAIQTNTWYDSIDRDLLEDPEFQENQRRIQEQELRSYRRDQQVLYEQSKANEPGLFKGLYSMLGLLSQENKKQILDYLNSPSEEKWDEISGYLIRTSVTLWQAWLKVDRDAPMTKPMDGPWPRIPEPETLRQAMRLVGDHPPYEQDK